jgi:hypothetical protein
MSSKRKMTEPLRKPVIRVLGPSKKDVVWLFFEVTLAPGERAEVRPSSALRSDGSGRASKDVPIDSIEPFKASRFAPRHGDTSGWPQEDGIVFVSIRLSNTKDDELAPGCEVPAWLVSHQNVFSTSMSAADVVFTVENQGTRTIKFAGHIEGVTLSEARR